jgi:arylsulfatase A-like enzyme/peroxiredoxin
LANSGAKLEAFYVQPVCSPTRAALMTGRYPIRHGLQVGVVRPWAQYGLPLEEQTIAQGLKSAGYATAIVGKWHLGHVAPEYLPTRRGFDHQYGHYNGALDYNTHRRDGGLDWHRDDAVSHDEGYTTHLLARESVRIIQQYANKKPFFLYVPFNAVHSPHQVPNKYLKGLDHLQGERRTYAGMLVAMDEAIGQIHTAIREAGIEEQTLIVFTSDNGGPQPGKVTSNGNLRAGKATHYEGGVRVAAFATWPGKIAANSVVTEPLHIVDWYPTLLRLAGAQIEQRLPLDGRDLWDTLTAGAPSPHEDILINATPANGALRAGPWKLVVVSPRSPSAEEADTDPNEATDLAQQHPEIVERLFATWRAYRDAAVPPKVRPKPADFVSPAIWGDFPAAIPNPGEVGSLAPEFTSRDDAGNPWISREHVGKKRIVLYFYPADMTGGCTKQACSYRDAIDDFDALDATIIGISGDSVENHRAFKRLHQLNFTLLSDPDGKIAESFGVPVTREPKKVVANVDGKELVLTRDVTTKRWTFVIDTDGKILYRNDAVVAPEDSQNVLRVLREATRGK